MQIVFFHFAISNSPFYFNSRHRDCATFDHAPLTRWRGGCDNIDDKSIGDCSLFPYNIAASYLVLFRHFKCAWNYRSIQFLLLFTLCSVFSLLLLFTSSFPHFHIKQFGPIDRCTLYSNCLGLGYKSYCQLSAIHLYHSTSLF